MRNLHICDFATITCYPLTQRHERLLHAAPSAVSLSFNAKNTPRYLGFLHVFHYICIVKTKPITNIKMKNYYSISFFSSIHLLVAPQRYSSLTLPYTMMKAFIISPAHSWAMVSVCISRPTLCIGLFAVMLLRVWRYIRTTCSATNGSGRRRGVIYHVLQYLRNK